MNTLAQVLAAARQRIGASEARLLLSHVLGRGSAWIEAHREDSLTVDEVARFTELVARRGEGEPVAYLLGTREFYGRDFIVDRDVLIPRPETELLVDLAREKCISLTQPRILDLGTGSGCIAITLALELHQPCVSAVDASAAALRVARTNAQAMGAAVRFVEGHWMAPLAGELFDLIVSNPPYVAAADPHLTRGDLRFEPATALTGGEDGLCDIRQIVESAPDCLAPGGWLLIEHGYDQAPALRALLADAGFREVGHWCDLAGIPRVSGGCRA
ncbi:MAG TPA: peptide chain release factor N(5)-glutamine methyltransferase [Rhodocyclaceae bacterium]|nr:peptide chain release factor N(5)-glutamine methyltransferase [Rhodocyclaceae bacterium]